MCPAKPSQDGSQSWWLLCPRASPWAIWATLLSSCPSSKGRSSITFLLGFEPSGFFIGMRRTRLWEKHLVSYSWILVLFIFKIMWNILIFFEYTLRTLYLFHMSGFYYTKCLFCLVSKCHSKSFFSPFFFFSSRNFMNKNQKPVLTGQRFKTRKRGRLLLHCFISFSSLLKLLETGQVE